MFVWIKFISILVSVLYNFSEVCYFYLVIVIGMFVNNCFNFFDLEFLESVIFFYFWFDK